jgi:hypothetical protein
MGRDKAKNKQTAPGFPMSKVVIHENAMTLKNTTVTWLQTLLFGDYGVVHMQILHAKISQQKSTVEGNPGPNRDTDFFLHILKIYFIFIYP